MLRSTFFICLLLVGITLTTALQAQQESVSKHAFTAKQKQELNMFRATAEKKAGPLAIHFAQLVKQIYENMLADHPDEDLRIQLDRDMKDTTWELLSVKGQAIRECVLLLDGAQKQILREELAKPGAPSDLGELMQKLF